MLDVIIIGINIKRGDSLKAKGKRRLKYFSRQYWMPLLLGLILLLVFGKLVSLQIVNAADLEAKGIQRRASDQSVKPERGSIFDAQGNVLAQSQPVREVYANPRMLDQLATDGKLKTTKAEIAKNLSALLGTKEEDILAKLNKDLAWISLAHGVEIATAEKIMTLDIPGVGLSNEEKRVYPMDTLAASVLGIVNMDGHGVEGLEAYYDQQLYGNSVYQTNSSQTDTDSGQTNNAGNNLTLTLDSTIQFLIEQQLDSTMEETKAKSVTILAMDPSSGKIIGMGSRPSFNPNDYQNTTPEERRNRAISMSYEPGSTFKIITGAAALEEGTITPEDTFEDNGYYQIGPRVITNWDSDHRKSGNLTFTEGMEHSSNVVLAQVGLKLGKEPFFTYLKAFGFGSKTGIDITGEESGLLVSKDQARDIDLATMSFGQANLVTPVQLLSGICAVANGGTLYKPYIVDKITAPNGTLIQQNKPSPVRQVISKNTSAQMVNILTKVVTEGTGQSAQIPGINVAGKSGTAQKIDPETGEYSTTDYIASFAAFAPAENPKIAILFIVDSPQEGEHQGGIVAAPRVKTILEGALQYYGVPVANDTPSDISSSISAEDQPVRPSPQEVTPEREPGSGEVVVPDLTGLTMRQAGETLGKLKLHFNFTGNGLVSAQDPTPGKVVNAGSQVQLKFAPLINSP